MGNVQVLITGSNGLLGQKLVNECRKNNISFLATSKGINRNPDCPENSYVSLDITKEPEVKSLVEKYRPEVIINTAAMTNVDGCEDHKDLCELLNVTAVGHLKSAAKEAGAHLIHFSTDFIFDGEQGNYSEEDIPNPLSIYGESKLDSEKLLLDGQYDKITIIRTIVVYGQGYQLTNGNIFEWAREKLLNGEPLTIVNDQYRAPTYAPDLAKATLELAKQKEYGVFHVAGPETLNIYQIIKRLAKWLKVDENLVQPINSKTLNQKALRPPKTGFDLSKIKKTIDYQPLTLELTFEEMWG